MAFYEFKVKDDSGRTIYGVMQAPNAKEVKIKINRTKYYFVSAVPLNKEKFLRSRVKFQTLIMFTHRMSSLVEAGIPILQAMDILWRQTEDKTIQMMSSHVKARLEEGNKISDTLEQFPNIFPAVYTALVRVGELSGSLISVLRKLSEYLDYKQQMISRTKRATLYPMIVVVFSLIVLIAMFLFVVPTFQKLLLRLKVELPLITKIILGISQVMKTWQFWLILVTGSFGLWVLFRFLKKIPRFARFLDHTKLRVPYFGTLIKTFSLSQFFRSLSIMVAAGVPIVESLGIARTTAGNKKISEDLEETRKKVEMGSSLYDSFNHNPDFPIMLREMIGVGESSGMLVPILEKLTNHFDEEVDYELNRFLTYLEPALIVVVGMIVIVVLLAIYLPVVSIWQGIMS